uniref:Putative secreted protein n=1 Tax=Ixodes ricinus TaxID=34613 RepID=A0A6B0U6S4_IXORI
MGVVFTIILYGFLFLSRLILESTSIVDSGFPSTAKALKIFSTLASLSSSWLVLEARFVLLAFSPFLDNFEFTTDAAAL